MSIDWTKVITEPLGIVGFTMALVFGIVSRVVAQKSRKNGQWIVAASYVLAAVCVLGGLVLAYNRQSTTVMINPNSGGLTQDRRTNGQAASSLRVDKIDQNVHNGTAVAGVQGDVTVNATAPKEESKSK